MRRQNATYQNYPDVPYVKVSVVLMSIIIKWPPSLLLLLLFQIIKIKKKVEIK